MSWKWLMVAGFGGLLSATTLAQAGPGDGEAVALDPAPAQQCSALADSDPRLEPVVRLCRFAASYRQSLPNFVCRQQTIRYEKAEDAKPSSVVTATVTYEQGQERYSDIAINGQALKRSMRKIEGLTSWGEFGNQLVMLFQWPGGAAFQFSREDSSRGVPVDVFGFHVAREDNVDWLLADNHGERRPEYRGELFVSRATGRLMQIDIEALGLDERFEVETFRTSTEFDLVPLNGKAAFLLPMRSTATACLRPTRRHPSGICKRNLLEFRSCRRFGSESRVIDAQPLP